MSVFTQIIILLIVLAVMVMILIGIRQLTHFEGFEDTVETDHLKKDLEENGNVLSNNNIFHSLVEVEPEKDRQDHKENSREPFSPK